MRASSFVAIVLALSEPTLATDRIVGPPGSGAPFTSIQAAIDASQPGHRVLIQAGTYQVFATVLVNKAIEVIGAGSSASIVTVGATVPGQFPPPLRITGIPAGMRARVSGIGLATLAAPALAMPCVLGVDASPGRVEISDVVSLVGTLPPLPMGTLGGLVYVQDCAQVVVAGLQAAGSDQPNPLPVIGTVPAVHGPAGVVVERSGLWMADSSAIGTATRTPTLLFGGDGGAGILAIDSWVQISRSIIRGAQSGGLQNGVAGAGGAGIDAVNSNVVIHGGSGNSTNGAAAYEVTASGATGLGTAGAGVRLDPTSLVGYGTDVVLSGGLGSATLPPALPVVAAAGASVYALVERLPTVSLTPATVHIGTTPTVELSGQPGAHFRAVALQTAPSASVTGLLGFLLVDLTSVLAIEIVTLGASGSATVLVPVPPDPALAGLIVVEQAAQVLSFGILLTPPALSALVL